MGQGDQAQAELNFSARGTSLPSQRGVYSDPSSAMSAARATAGSLLALFVVGAVVHYRSARQASSDFVSASAIDVDSLTACGAPTEAATVTADTLLTGIITKDNGPCACGKSVCTAGRICLKDPKDEGNDQCYLPRCNVKAVPEAIKDEYFAGCVCGEDAVCKSGVPETVILTEAASPGLPTCANKEITTTRCVCSTEACDAGVLCDNTLAVGKVCGGKPGVVVTSTVSSQTTALIVPGNLTDPTKFAICKNTNSGGKVKCVKDATDGNFCVKM